MFSLILLAFCFFPLLMPLIACGGQENAFSPDAPQEILLPAATPSPSPAPSPEPVTSAPTATPAPEPTEEDYLSLYIQNMNADEKIGQLVMFGFEDNRAASLAFAAFIKEYSLGNLFLCSPNIVSGMADGGFARCKELTASLEEINPGKIPFLISIDEEGGTVTRFGWRPKPPTAASLGRRNDPDAARELFKNIGEGLLSAGIHMNLAPCLDVTKAPRSSWLKNRIFSGDEQIVSTLGIACIEGLQGIGCMSVVKHFPGHGATSKNSHKGTPLVRKSLDELLSYELIPFQSAIDAGVDGVMIAHISYPNIDGKNIASMSEVIIGQLLRERMGFDGLVLSDDFLMGGLVSRYAPEEAAVRFILAGGDIILCGPRLNMQKQIMTALRAAVENGTISLDRLDQSVARILRAKMKYLSFVPR